MIPAATMSASAARTNGRGFARATRTHALSEPGADRHAKRQGGSKRVYNFSAGPACIYEDVLEQAQRELLDYGLTTGMGVMEMSHRGPAFTDIRDRAEADLRRLLGVPDDYAVLFLQGGASTQFASVPLNLAWREAGKTHADYVVTGSWSKKAVAEGRRLGIACNLAAEGDNASIPDRSLWSLGDPAKTAYLHICANETIQGVEFKATPADLPADVPLVADMSSNFCSKPIAVSDYGVIYAGAQKNVGPSGVTCAIVRRDLIGNCRPDAPTMLDWATMASTDSMHNTPPTYAIYVMGLVFSKLLSLGGLEQVERTNKHKCGLLYDAIESSAGFFGCPVDPKVRSAMNVPFVINAASEAQEQALAKAFLSEAQAEGMVNLKGHRSVGGMRASIYNAMPVEGVEKLTQFMADFQARHGG